jgi:hypothetical protein
MGDETCSPGKHTFDFSMAITLGEELLIPCRCGERVYAATATKGGLTLHLSTGDFDSPFS